MRHSFRRRLSRSLLAVGVVASLGAACGSDEPSTASGAAASRERSGTTTDAASSMSDDARTAPPGTGLRAGGDAPQDGGTLTFLTGTDAPSLDPISINSLSIVHGTRHHAIYDALALEESSTAEVVNRIAESWDTSDDTTWTLKLRPGVRFSDGTSFDAEAVKAQWDRVADPANNAPLQHVAETMTSIEVLDPLTLRVTLDAPNGQWPRTIASSPLTYIPSPTALAAAGPEAFASAAVGAGPFMVSRFVPEDTLELTRNPDYYGDVHLDKVVFKVVADQAQRVGTAQTTDHAIAQVTDPTVTQQIDSAGLERVATSPNGGNNIVFNMAKPPFDDPLARRAVQQAIDNAALTETVTGDPSLAATTIFQEGSPFYVPSLVQEFDKTNAQALFDEYAASHGGPLKFTLTSIPAYSASANYVAALLSEFDNVEVTINEIGQTALIEWYLTGQHEAGMSTFTFLDGGGLALWFGPGGPSNFMSYANPDVDAALEVGRSSAPAAERAEAYATAQQHILEDVPVVWLFRLQTTYAFDSSVQLGTRVTNYGAPLLNEIWIEA